MLTLIIVRRSPSTPSSVARWIGVVCHATLIKSVIVTAAYNVAILHVSAYGALITILRACGLEYRATDIALRFALLATATNGHIHLVLLSLICHSIIK